MKHSILLAVMATATLLPAPVWAQYTQLIPDAVKCVRVENYAQLHVLAGNETRIEVEGNDFGRVKGNTLILDKNEGRITVYMAPGRTMTFNTQDFSRLMLEGDFAPIDSLCLHAEDYSKITYTANPGDTLRVRSLNLQTEDYSVVDMEEPLQYANSVYRAEDYSRIHFASVDCSDRLLQPGQTLREQLFFQQDVATVLTDRYTVNGVEAPVPHSVDVGGTPRELADMIQEVSNMTRNISNTAASQRERRQVHPWRTEIDLAFGWHNWGGSIGTGFNGVLGWAAVNTNFHNIQLAVNIPLVNTRGFAIKAGLGMDWDRYTFNLGDVEFNETADPMTFSAGSSAAPTWAETHLKTRSVVVPLKMEFGNPKKWHFSVAALPGLNWSGKNTGLRREIHAPGGTTKEKDYEVNQYFNPYKLDVRVAVQYKSMGLYVQAATLPLLRDGCQPLYPIKFGIIL